MSYRNRYTFYEIHIYYINTSVRNKPLGVVLL